MNQDEITRLSRARAVDILGRHTESKTSLRHTLRLYLQKSRDDPAIKSQVQYLAINAIRYKNTIDYLLVRGDPALSFSKLDVEDQNRLRLALFESRWLNEPLMTLGSHYLKWRTKLRSVLQTAAEIDLNQSVESLSRIEKLSVLYSHPTFIIETLLEYMNKDEVIELMKENQTPPLTYVRPNKLSEPGLEPISRLSAKGISLVPDDIQDVYILREGLADLVQTKEFKEGAVLIHDKASIIAVDVFDPQSEQIVWDACAAPGMKTQYICEKMLNKGKLIASDINRNRLKGSMKRLRSWGCSSAHWLLADAIECPIIGADKILIDAPCTSTGMLQSHPSYKWRLNKDWLFSLMTIQSKLLESVISSYSAYPETEIVYSTCSILPHEGESQIDSALERFDIELREIDGISGQGYSGFNCSKKVKRFFPHTHRTNGFFLAKFRII